MSNQKRKLVATVLAAIVGLATGLLPARFSIIGMVLFLTGMLVLIIIAHKAAYRAHPHGVFSQWTAPRQFVKISLSEGEAIAALVAAASLVSAFIAFIFKGVVF